MLRKEVFRKTFSKEFKGQKDSIRRNHAFLRKEYGINVRMGRFNERKDKENLKGLEKLTLLNAVVALRVIRKEVEKYPAEYVKSCRIKSFRLAKIIRDSVPEGSDEDEVMVGLAVPWNGSVYVSMCEGIFGLKETVHHELFHMALEDVDDSELDQGEDFSKAKSLIENVLKEDEEEAWADNVEQLMTYPHKTRRLMEERIVFREKIKEIMDFMEERSGGKMDKRYFDDLLSGRVERGYWQK